MQGIHGLQNLRNQSALTVIEQELIGLFFDPFRGPLSGHPIPRFIRRHATPVLQPSEPQHFRSRHGPDGIAIGILPGLEQDGRLSKHQVRTSSFASCFPRLKICPNSRMNQGIQGFQRGGVRKHLRRQSRPIQPAIFSENVRPKPVHHGPQQFGVFGIQTFGSPVCIVDRIPQASEHTRNRGLARPDSPSQADAPQSRFLLR